MSAFPGGDHVETSELPPAPEAVNVEVWRAFGAMFDVKLTPVTRTLNALDLVVGELQQHAVHRVQFVNTIQTCRLSRIL